MLFSSSSFSPRLFLSYSNGATLRASLPFRFLSRSSPADGQDGSLLELTLRLDLLAWPVLRTSSFGVGRPRIQGLPNPTSGKFVCSDALITFFLAPRCANPLVLRPGFPRPSCGFLISPSLFPVASRCFSVSLCLPSYAFLFLFFLL